MAGFDKVYLFGHTTYDGINGIRMEIWRGISDRMWLEPAPGFRSRPRRVRSTVPKGPDDPDMLIDAAMAFYPEAFRSVPDYCKMYESLGKDAFLDFDSKHGIPEDWPVVRELVRPIFNQLTIYQAELKPLQAKDHFFSSRRE